MPLFSIFATWIVQSLSFLNLKFQASSHLLWPQSLICVGPGWKPKDRFSHMEAQLSRKRKRQKQVADHFSCFSSLITKNSEFFCALYFSVLSISQIFFSNYLRVLEFPSKYSFNLNSYLKIYMFSILATTLNLRGKEFSNISENIWNSQ